MALWTVTLRGLTIGDGTDYPLTEPGPTGLGVPTPRIADQERGGLDGHVGGYDVLPRRVITIPVGVNATDDLEAWTLYDALKLAWKPSQEDIPLVLSFAGATLTYMGRPRGLEPELSYVGQGWVSALCHFEALHPYAVGEAETEPAP